MIRTAHHDDIPAMHRIRLAVRENRLLSSDITEADYAPFLREHGRGWVAEDNGLVVGFAIGDGRNGNIWALFLDPNHEGNGHGRRLLEAMTSWLWSRGFERVWLTTDRGTRAQKFYETAGWHMTGIAANGELRFELCRPCPGSASGLLASDSQ